MQTRGGKTRALGHGGGFVREISSERIRALLIKVSFPHDAHIVDRLHRILRWRLVDVDAPRKTIRDDDHLKRIESAAHGMLDALRGYEDWGLVTLGVRDKFAAMGWDYDDRAFYRWLLIVRDLRNQVFDPFDPSAAYHSTIRDIRREIEDGGGKVAVHATSSFVGLLLGLEAETPGLIFPPNTVATERARSRYVERALTPQDSTN